MAWDNGYYYRSYRECNRVLRHYLGRGPAAEAAAAEDRQRRDELQRLKEQMRQDEADWGECLAALHRFADAVAVLFDSELTGAGYHQHDRGEWRKRMFNGDQHDDNDARD